jgi:hypothetical protein
MKAGQRSCAATADVKEHREESLSAGAGAGISLLRDPEIMVNRFTAPGLGARGPCTDALSGSSVPLGGLGLQHDDLVGAGIVQQRAGLLVEQNIDGVGEPRLALLPLCDAVKATSTCSVSGLLRAGRAEAITGELSGSFIYRTYTASDKLKQQTK